MTSRTENGVKNRWKSLLKKHRLEFSKSVHGSNNELVLAQKILDIKFRELRNGVSLLAEDDQGIVSTPKGIIQQISPKFKRTGSHDNNNETTTIESINAALLNNQFCDRKPSNGQIASNAHDNIVHEEIAEQSKALNQKTTEVEIKNIGELPDFVESIGKLEICLFNGEEMKMYKGISPDQKARLHSMISAFLQSEAKEGAKHHQHNEEHASNKTEDEIYISRENLLETESTNNQPPLSRGNSMEEMLSYSPAGDLSKLPHFKRDFNLNIAIPSFDYEDPNEFLPKSFVLSPISSFFKEGLFCD
jgi:hypothetical protein